MMMRPRRSSRTSSSSVSASSASSSSTPSPALHLSPALSSSSSSVSSSSASSAGSLASLASSIPASPSPADVAKRLKRKRPLSVAPDRPRPSGAAAVAATPTHHLATDPETPHAPSPKRGKIERRLLPSASVSMADDRGASARAPSRAVSMPLTDTSRDTAAAPGLSQRSAAMLFRQSCRLIEQQTLEYEVRAAELEEEILRVVAEREQYEAKTKFLQRQLHEMRGDGADDHEEKAAVSSDDAAQTQQALPLDALLPPNVAQHEAAVQETLRERRTAIASILRDLHGVEGLEKQIARLR